MAVLEIDDLNVDIQVAAGILHAVRNVSLSIDPGKTLCLVGESGCGKSITSLAIMGLLPSSAMRRAKRLDFDGTDLLSMSDRDLRDVRGRDMSMIFQEPMTCLNACLTVGEQLMEVHRRHTATQEKKESARERALYLLEKVGIVGAAGRLRQYPHELSGGLRQRVMIAMALMCNPRLIIADEPTTALDVTIQAQILGLLQDLQAEFGLAILLVTHDLGIVARMADQVAVMYAGEVVEQAPKRSIFEATSHPYTRGLLACMPVPGAVRPGSLLGSIPGQVPSLIGEISGCSFRNRCSYALPQCAAEIPVRQRDKDHHYRCVLAVERKPAAPSALPISMLSENDAASIVIPETPLVQARALSQTYRISGGMFGPRRELRAVDRVSLSVGKGEIVAIVGESGCGKSTLAMMLLGLLPPTSGDILISGKPITSLGRTDLPRQMQPVFQDPYASLNPRRSVSAIVEEPLVIHRMGSAAERRRRVLDMLDAVGLPARLATAYPKQLSGGQRQRVAIARALIMRPALLICDEPTSALDVSVQSQVLNLLMELHGAFDLTYILISHNLAVVEHMAARVCVMHLGRIVEEGPIQDVFSNPRHPYTRVLLQSVLTPDPSLGVPRLALSSAQTPLAGELAHGCAFAPRCPMAFSPCSDLAPALHGVGTAMVECHLYGDETSGSAATHTIGSARAHGTAHTVSAMV